MAIYTKNNGLKGGHGHRKAWVFDRKMSRWVNIRKVSTFDMAMGRYDLDPSTAGDPKLAEIIKAFADNVKA